MSTWSVTQTNQGSDSDNNSDSDPISGRALQLVTPTSPQGTSLPQNVYNLQPGVVAHQQHLNLQRGMAATNGGNPGAYGQPRHYQSGTGAMNVSGQTPYTQQSSMSMLQTHPGTYLFRHPGQASGANSMYTLVLPQAQAVAAQGGVAQIPPPNVQGQAYFPPANAYPQNPITNPYSTSIVASLTNPPAIGPFTSRFMAPQYGSPYGQTQVYVNAQQQQQQQQQQQPASVQTSTISNASQTVGAIPLHQQPQQQQQQSTIMEFVYPETKENVMNQLIKQKENHDQLRCRDYIRGRSSRPSSIELQQQAMSENDERRTSRSASVAPQSTSGKVTDHKKSILTSQSEKAKELSALKAELDRFADPNGKLCYGHEYMLAASKLPASKIRPQFDTAKLSEDAFNDVFMKKRDSFHEEESWRKRQASKDRSRQRSTAPMGGRDFNLSYTDLRTIGQKPYCGRSSDTPATRGGGRGGRGHSRGSTMEQPMVNAASSVNVELKRAENAWKPGRKIQAVGESPEKVKTEQKIGTPEYTLVIEKSTGPKYTMEWEGEKMQDHSSKDKMVKDTPTAPIETTPSVLQKEQKTKGEAGFATSSPITTHVTLLETGEPAKQLRVSVFSLKPDWLPIEIAMRRTGEDGRTPSLLSDYPWVIGCYKIIFDTGEYFRNLSVADVTFQTVQVDLIVTDIHQRYFLRVIGPHEYSIKRQVLLENTK